MFCNKCGKQIFDEAVVCVGCGCPVVPVKPETCPPQIDLELAKKSDVKGVGGWLLVFCITLVFLTPICCVLSIIFNGILLFQPSLIYMTTRPGSGLIYGFYTVKSFVILIFSLIAGYFIGSGSPNGGVHAGNYFSVRFFFVFLEFIMLGKVGYKCYGNISDLLSDLFFTLIELAFVFAWAMYFKKSIRVKNTYGDNCKPSITIPFWG